METTRITALYRYPVKGLSPESVDRAALVAGGHFPHDRLYAVENGPSGFDPDKPAFQPKTRFLMLMKNERLARLRTTYSELTGQLDVKLDDAVVLRPNLGTPEGRNQLEAFLADYCKADLKGPPRVLKAPGHFRFTDSARSGFVSLLNLASVDDLAVRLGKPLDPLRFRANIHLEGLAPWREMDLVGKTLAAGPVRLKVLKPIVRCPATGVDPATGERDIDVVEALRAGYGHTNCGIYTKVIAGGEIAAGDKFVIES